MKKPILLAILLVFTTAIVNAQVINDLFEQRPTLSRNFHAVAGKYESFRINGQKLGTLRVQSPAKMDLQLPFENKVLKLKLQKVNITADNFSVIEAMPGGARRTVNYSGAVFYQGAIEGKDHSFATISILNGQVMGVIADEKSNIILGAIEDKGVATDEYALYREKDLQVPDPFSCATSDIPVGGNDAGPSIVPVARRAEAVGEPVDIYFECDYKFYQDKGSNTTNVINYVLGFFNNTALLYANENIKMQVSQILVWTTQDPEAAAAANTTSAVLTSFSTRMATATYSGDYAHFLSTRSLGGGIAYIPGNPCGSSKQYRTGASAINNSYNDFPTYSWTVEVVTHELGHNLGSNHTQWCGWTGGALDNCYATEGGCPAGPAPTNGGTIMSYCHTTSYGINLSNGFGQQPGDKIRAVVSGATCFGNCRMTIDIAKLDASCGQNNGSATVTATNGTGAITYTWSNGQTGASLVNVGPGNYSVTVKDASGCQVLGVVTLVNSGGTLNANLTPASPASFCTGGNQLLTATANAAYTYQWSKGGTPIGGAISNTYTATTAGNYSVNIVSGACSVTKTITITEVAVPVAAISAGGPTTFCSGGSVVLNGNAGVGYNYQWYKNGTAISAATNANYTVNASGNYTVRVSAGTCQSTSTATTVTINPVPTATITAGGAVTFCQGGNVNLTANAGSGLTYQWYNNSTAITGATNISYSATTSGSYTVKVTSNGCSTTSNATLVAVVTTPVAAITAGGPTTFCSGGQVTLTTGTGTGYTYQWYNNSAIINSATNNSYNATTSGSYTVKVSAGSCQATSSAVTVTVNPSPSASITAGGATSFCTGGSVTLNANTGAGYAYQWYNNAVVINSATTANYNAVSSGNYTVRVTSGSCSTTSAGQTVTVNTVPVATITAGGATAFCSGGRVTLTATQGTGLSYTWYNNSVIINGATAAMYDAVSSGSYTVKVAAGSCQAVSTAVPVTVTTTPAATATAAGATTFCAGGNVTLNANTGAFSYQWYKNGQAISAATNNSFVAATSGNYAVKVTSGSCSTTSSALTVVANPIPQANITAGGPISFCTEGSVDLYAPTGAGYSYQWYNNGVAINTAVNASYHAMNEGDYTVNVTAASCQARSSAVRVTVSPAPDAIITAGGATSFCGGGSVILHANTGSGYTYQWFRDGSIINGATSPNYEATIAGNYTVKIELGTCISTSAAKPVTVLPSPVVNITPAQSTIEKFQTQTFIASGASTYNWSSQPGFVSASGNSAIVKPLTTTTYTIEGTSANGCRGTATVSINVVGCGQATNLQASANSPARAVISWTNPQGSVTDTLRYRKAGSITWTKQFVSGQFYEINGLEPGTDYEYNVIPLCSSTTTFIPSVSKTFKTQKLGTGIYINLFPNPVVTPAKLEIIMDHPFTLQVSLYNNMGQLARPVSPLSQHPAGQVITIIDPAGLQTGMYNLVALVNGKRYSLKMVVVR